MDKTCRECGSTDPKSGWVVKGNICKECQRKLMKKHYQENKQYYVAKAKRNTANVIAATRINLVAYLEQHPCVDCGEDDIVVLEFDHRDAESKSFSISNAVHREMAWKKILDEISKCDVRCANCHRRRTSVQFGWWKTPTPVCPLATNELEG